MKKLLSICILLVTVAVFITSCGGGEKKEETTNNESDDYGTEAAPPSSDDLVKQGQVLVDASDCKTCHHATNKIVGPAHTEVAKKYEFTRANVTLLAGKIINGGAGVWGEVPMTPHADMSQADAEKMAMYVLSLDGEKLKD